MLVAYEMVISQPLTQKPRSNPREIVCEPDWFKGTASDVERKFLFMVGVLSLLSGVALRGDHIRTEWSASFSVVMGPLCICLAAFK